MPPQVQSRPSASGSPATADLSIPPYSVPIALIFCRSHGSSVLRYGIGGLGSGATPQMADAQDGRGGGGISEPFPCRDGEQFGSFVGSHFIQLPVKVSLLGNGAV